MIERAAVMITAAHFEKISGIEMVKWCMWR